MEQKQLPIKTKIVAWWMIAIGLTLLIIVIFLGEILITPSLPSPISYKDISFRLLVLISIFVITFLFIPALSLLLIKNKWAWLFAVMMLLIGECTVSLLLLFFPWESRDVMGLGFFLIMLLTPFFLLLFDYKKFWEGWLNSIISFFNLTLRKTKIVGGYMMSLLKWDFDKTQHIEEGNKNLKKANIFRIIERTLMILVALGCIVTFFLSNIHPDLNVIFFAYLIYVGIPLFAAIISLSLWRKYIFTKEKYIKKIASILTIALIIYVAWWVGNVIVNYSEDNILPNTVSKITQEAVSKGNFKQCDKIIHLPIFLFFRIYGNLFNRSPTSLRAECVTEVAISQKNESLCESLTEETTPSHYGDSKSWCYIEVATAKQDIAICERIEIKEARGDCYRWVISAIGHIDISRQFVVDELVRDYAIKVKDIRFCDGAGIEDINCKREIKIATEEVLAPCRNLLSIEEKEKCIKDIAIEKDSLELCGLLEPFTFGRLPLAGECYTKIAIDMNNPEICKYIKVEKAKESCYEQLNIQK